MRLHRLAAFADGGEGGNPAGVVLAETMPDEAFMRRVAREVGYSETAFVAPWEGGARRVRYFAPQAEVPFCGHATVALGAVLAAEAGAGTYALVLNDARITVEARRDAQGRASATLTSPPASSLPAEARDVEAACTLFGLTAADLDPRLPPAAAQAGARHLVLALQDRARLRAMAYDFDAGRAWMTQAGFVTVALVHAETERLFHARNAFAPGGVYEDPATGAAAAALGGLLRDRGWPHGGSVEVVQGEDMGARSRIFVRIPPEPAAGVLVSGAARDLAPPQTLG